MLYINIIVALDVAALHVLDLLQYKLLHIFAAHTNMYQKQWNTHTQPKPQTTSAPCEVHVPATLSQLMHLTYSDIRK